MNPVIIAAGICLSARVISYIAGELTESEIKTQIEIDNGIEQIRADYEGLEKSDAEEAVQVSEQVNEKKREMRDFLRLKVKARKDKNDELHKEIKEAKKEVRKALRAENVVNTPLRKSSLELLLRQLSEAQERCYSYGQYLDAYYDEIGRLDDFDEPPVFNMQLPSNYPYIGKVIWGKRKVTGC